MFFSWSVPYMAEWSKSPSLQTRMIFNYLSVFTFQMIMPCLSILLVLWKCSQLENVNASCISKMEQFAIANIASDFWNRHLSSTSINLNPLNISCVRLSMLVCDNHCNLLWFYDYTFNLGIVCPYSGTVVEYGIWKHFLVDYYCLHFVAGFANRRMLYI